MKFENEDDLSQSRTFAVDLESLPGKNKLTLKGVRLEDLRPTDQAARLEGALAPGSILDDKYKIGKNLGQGGMGIVVEAEQLNLRRNVALKTFNREAVDRDAGQRFQREVQAIARLRHANIVQVFDSGAWGEKRIPYYTMEILSGLSLAECIEANGPLPLKQVLEIFSAVCLGLAHAHKNDIVHRDIKPANIFLSEDTGGLPSIPKLLDFGIAKLAVAANDNASQSLTNTGHIFGSPLYMSPEQIMAGEVDLRSDIYSLGCTIYHAICGTPPFAGATAFATMQLHLAASPPHLPTELKAMPAGRDLNLVVQRMLAKDPEKRYQSATEVQDALERLQTIAKKGSVDVAPPAVINRFGGSRQFHKMTYAVAAIALIATGLLAVIWKFYTPKVGQPQIEKSKVVGLATDIPNYKKVEGYEKVSSAGEPDEVPIVAEGSFSEHFANGQRRLHVPPFVGELRAKILNEKLTAITGQGTLLQNNSTLELRASPLTFSHTELLRGFKPDDLLILHLDQGDRFDSEQFKNVAYLQGLEQLSVDGGAIDKVSVPYLNRLKNLKFLSLNSCSGTADDFAKLTILPQLRQITITNPAFKNRVFALMGQLPRFIDLSVKSCKLTDSDLERIARLSQMRALNLDDNPSITDLGITSISRLKNLEVLSLNNIKVSPRCLEKLSVARELRLAWNLYSPAQKNELTAHFGKKLIWQGMPSD